MSYDFSHLVGSLLPFETGQYPFRDLFLDEARAWLGTSGATFGNLGELHHHIQSTQVEELSQRLYGLLKGDSFRGLYRRFISDVVAPRFSGPILYQRTPSIRVNLPGMRSVYYHCDQWYGHGPNIVNLWMPLTKVFATNSLFTVSLVESQREIARLEQEKATVEVINSRLDALASPVEADYGQLYIFSSKVAHGTRTNSSEHSRVSLDFRLLLDGEDAGTKPVFEFYDSLVASADSGPGLRACAYVYIGHGFTRFLSHEQQRITYQAYAREHGISVVQEETEIRTMSHSPQLLFMLEGATEPSFDAVLLYSVLSLPEGYEDRQRIYGAARRSGRALLFANEDLTFPECGEAVIEARRAQLQFVDTAGRLA